MSGGLGPMVLDTGERLVRVVRDRVIDRARQNHAIEHATITTLLAGGAHPPLAGNSTPRGFFIYGKVSKEEVAAAAEAALQLLQEGDRELAVSPYCGTNLIVGALIAGAISGVLMGRTSGRFKSMPVMGIAILGSTLLSRPLGNAVQRRFTTLAHVDDVEIVGIRTVRLGSFMVHRVRTGRVLRDL